jgi:hypothetical protein
MRLRVLLVGVCAVMLPGLAVRPARAQYWHGHNGHNPYYSFFWHQYWYNYGNPGFYHPPRYWQYNPYWYGYGYPGAYPYYVPYYVPVPDPYPAPSSRAPAAKAAEKAEAQKPVAPEKEPRVLPAQPKAPLAPEEKKKQQEQDAARQLRLAKTLLQAADEEQATGKADDAKRLRELAQGHFAEIAQKYPATPAGKEAQQLLEQEKTP